MHNKLTNELGTGQQFNQTDDLFDQIVYRPGEYSARQVSQEESSPKMECSYPSPPPPPPSITTAEVVHNPPPSYDAIASESKGKDRLCTKYSKMN